MRALKTDIIGLLDCRLAASSYGGRLEMIHDEEKLSPATWFQSFRNVITSSVGNTFLPIYRMADGEFILMFGFRWNWRHKNPLWSFASYLKYQSIWYSGKGFRTSWGETYSRDEIAKIRKSYRAGIAEVLNGGMVCPFLYATGNHQYESHKRQALRFFSELSGGVMSDRIYPFHFPFLLMGNSVGNEAHILDGRKVLVVSGLDTKEQRTVRDSLQLIGCRHVDFLPISKSRSMFDKIPDDSSSKFADCEIALIAAGIGSLNVIRQMSWFNGPVIDVGGFMRCLKERDFVYHGGACRFPEID